MVLSSALVALAVLLCLPVEAQVVQDDWLNPALPDFSASLLLGSNYTIKWTKNLYSWFPQYAPAADVTNVDLWLISTLSAYTQSIKNGINVRQTQSINWVVDVPPDFLAASTEYSFQFRPATAADTNQQVASPQFIVRNTDSSPSSTAVTTSSASSTSSTTSASSLPSTSTTTTPAPAQRSSFPPGAIAGIVIGAAAVIVMAIGIFLFKKKRASQVPHDSPQQAPETTIYYTAQPKQEDSGRYNVGNGIPAESPPHAAELPSHVAELPSHVAELPSYEARS